MRYLLSALLFMAIPTTMLFSEISFAKKSTSMCAVKICSKGKPCKKTKLPCYQKH